jgi:putative peptidoglycan lipid II flippase
MTDQHEQFHPNEDLPHGTSTEHKEIDRRNHVSILTASASIALLTLLVRSIGAIKELAVARVFGRGETLDAFLGALILPTVMINMFVTSVTILVVPTLIRIRSQKGNREAHEFASSLGIYLLGFLSILALLLGFSADLIVPWVCRGFGAETLRLTISTFRWLLPTLPLSGACALWSGFLNSRSKFVLPAVTPTITPTLTIVLLMKLGPHYRILPLLLGLLGGAIIETIVLGVFVRRLGMPTLPRWHPFGPDIRTFVGQYLPLLASALLVNTCVIVDQSMAASLGLGGLSGLAYGSKFTSMILSVVAAGMGVAILPRASTLIAEGDWEGLNELISWICRPVAWIAACIAIVMVWLSTPITRILFERGAFSPTDTATVSHVQAMFALQMPFFLLGIIFARLFTALSASHILMRIASLNLLLNIIGNYALSRILGIAGIALSSSIVQLVSCSLMATILPNYLKGRQRRSAPGL